VDVEHLVGDPVAVEGPVGHRLGRPDNAEDDVPIEIERDSAGDRIALRRDVTGLRQVVAVNLLVGRFEPNFADGLDLVGPRRRNEVVQQG